RVAVGVELGSAVEALRKQPELHIRQRTRAPADLAGEAIHGAAGRHVHQTALGIASLLRDDVDDAVDRIRTPDCAARAADNLDAIDVREHDVLHVPVDAFEQRRVDAAAVDENEQALGELAVEAAYRDGPLIALLARDIDAGNEPQELRDAGCAGAANIVLGE